MIEDQRTSLLQRLLRALGLRSDEIAAGHGGLPEGGTRPSTESRMRSRERQRERATEEDAERAAKAISEAAGSLDEEIQRSVAEQSGPETSEDMVQRARERWSSD